jgi:hypothetical protein
MAYNVPTVTQNNISFGPATVKMGTYISGTACTPAVDVGALSEDGVNIEITSEKRYISQGNPLSAVYAFSTTQGVKVSFTSLEWSFDRFIDALGAGNTSVGSGAPDVDFKWGGDPLVTTVGLLLTHYMAQSTNTMTVNVWKTYSDMGLTVPFGQEEHSFEMSFTAANATIGWDGVAALSVTNELIEFYRDSTA